MAATVYLQEWNGVPGSEVGTAKIAESIQFKSADDATVEAYAASTTPLRRPNAGVYRSYEKQLRVFLEGLGGSTSISNIQIYTLSPVPTKGTAIWVRLKDAYENPKTGGYLPAGAIDGDKVNIATCTLAEPLDIAAGPFNVAQASIGPFISLQMDVYPSADEAEANTVIMVRYDEE